MIRYSAHLDSYFLRGFTARGLVHATAPIRLRGARGEFILPNEPDGIPPFGRSRIRSKSVAPTSPPTTRTLLRSASGWWAGARRAIDRPNPPLGMQAVPPSSSRMSTRKTARALKTTPGRKQAVNRDLIDTGTDNRVLRRNPKVSSRSLTTSAGRSPQIIECAPTRRRRAARVTRATGRQFHVHSDGSEGPLMISNGPCHSSRHARCRGRCGSRH